MTATAGGSPSERISCSTYAYGYWEVDRALESIARVGYRGVELLTHGVGRPDGKGGRQVIYHLRPEWPEERIAAVQDQVGRLGLQPVCLSPATDFLAPRHGSVQADIDEVCRHVDLAARFGAPLVRPFAADRLPEGMDRDAAIDTIAQALRECGRYAASKGVRLAVENHGQFPGVAENMVAILERADSPAVGLCLHIPRPTAEELIERVPDKIWHMHLSDRGPENWREIRRLQAEGLSREEIAARLGVAVETIPERTIALGEGTADLPGIVQAVKATGYDGWWNHEGGPEPNPEPTEERSVAYLKQLLR
ncbi:MAG TPA: sugar phosphate isomerase/epimerase family protein [Chloroflexota bacterium]|nr:sugar phosphate isomerase/epimerase family protein [Chloroflexota bacterium]